MKRLCIVVLLIAILMSGCIAGETGRNSDFSESSTSSVKEEVELTEYASESLGIRFELDSKWVVEDSPLEPTLNLSIGSPMTGITFTIVEGCLDPEQYTNDRVVAWLEMLRSDYYANEETEEVREDTLVKAFPLRSGQTKQGLSYFSISDIYKQTYQNAKESNGAQSMMFQELWYWINLPGNKVLVIGSRNFWEKDSNNEFDVVSDKIAELVDSIQYIGEPIGYGSPEFLLPE